MRWAVIAAFSARSWSHFGSSLARWALGRCSSEERMCRGRCLLERVEFVLEGSEVLGDVFALLDDGGGPVAEVGDKGGALFSKLDKVDESGEDEAGAFWFGEVEILCAKVHDAGCVCEAGEVVEEKVVCDAGDVEILGGVRRGDELEKGRTVFGSSSAASALCTGSCRTSGVMFVTCSRQAVYTPVTKSEEGRASCSLLTERPHSERAVMISGMGMFGNQYCPDMMTATEIVASRSRGPSFEREVIIRFVDLSPLCCHVRSPLQTTAKGPLVFFFFFSLSPSLSKTTSKFKPAPSAASSSTAAGTWPTLIAGPSSCFSFKYVRRIRSL